MQTPPLHTPVAAVILLFISTGCTTETVARPDVAEVHRLTVERTTTHSGAQAETACDPAVESWAIGIARRAVEEREDREAWPHGADYRLIRHSAVQWWVIARRIAGHDESGKPRFEELWDRGIIIDDLGNVMFYVPAR